MKTETKYKKLLSILQNLQNAVIAYSGGVDSSFLLYAAASFYRTNTKTAIVHLDTMFKNDFNFALSFAQKLDVQLTIIPVQLREKTEFEFNYSNRCYFCKHIIFSAITKKFSNLDSVSIIDGTNYDDKNEFRPGRKAMKQFNIISPLEEAKLTKKEIRKLSKQFNLSIYKKESNTCLLTRFPHNFQITKNNLKRIEKMENFIRKHKNFSKLRVRYIKNNIINIETTKKDLSFFQNKDFLNNLQKQARNLQFSINKILEGSCESR